MSVIRNTSNVIGALSGAAFAQFDPVKTTTAGSLGELTVIKAAAASDEVFGVARWDATAAGENVDLFMAGDVCKMRVGAGGVTKDDYLKLGTDPLEVETYTPGGGTTNQLCIGQALETGAENDYISVRLILANDVVA